MDKDPLLFEVIPLLQPQWSAHTVSHTMIGVPDLLSRSGNCVDKARKGRAKKKQVARRAGMLPPGSS